MSFLFELITIPKFLQSIMGNFPKREASLGYRIRGIISTGIIFSCCFIETYNAIHQIGDFVKFSQSLYMQITALNNLLRVIVITYKTKELLKCIDMLETPSFITYNEQYNSEFKPLKKICIRTQVTFFLLLNMSMIFYALFPVFGSKPLPLEFPHFNTGIFHYYFYVYELIALYLNGAYIESIDFLCFAFMLISVFQLRKLNRKLAEMGENVKKLPNYSEKNSEKFISEYLKECCIHYSDIEEFSNCLQNCFRIIYFAQMFTGCVSISNAVFLLRTISPASSEGIALITYIMGIFAELGIFCWFGNMVNDESLEIGTSCYFSCWYECSPSVRRSIFILMERAKRPIEVKGLNLITLSLETLIAVLKWTYSYFTLLRDFKK